MHEISRRRLLTLAGTVGAASVVGLTGCRSETTAPTDGGGGSDVTLPSYVAYEGVPPDLAGTESGVMPGFYEIPDLVTAVDEVPGDGREISGLIQNFGGVPPGPSENAFWRGLQERLGLQLSLTISPNTDYQTVFSTRVAGGDLPDLVQVPPQLVDPGLFESQFTELSEHLSGSAVEEYPHLAGLLPDAWQQAVFGGGLYGIPIPRGVVGTYFFQRLDVIAARGLPSDPTTYDDLLEISQELTDPAEQRWAFGTANAVRILLGRINGEPNYWREDPDGLVRDIETDEFEQTVADMVQMWDAGVLHPDAFSGVQPAKELFNSGRIAFHTDGYAAWRGYMNEGRNTEGYELGLYTPYLRDGSAIAPWHRATGVSHFTGITLQDDPETVPMILRAMNWLASPFGTDEWFYINNGTIGVESELGSDGVPVRTDEGQRTLGVPFGYIASPPQVLFEPGHPEQVDTQHAFQSEVLAHGLANPGLGLYSPTQQEKAGGLDNTFYLSVYDIVQGRRPVSDLEALRETWRSGGGDQMRSELEEQL